MRDRLASGHLSLHESFNFFSVGRFQTAPMALIVLCGVPGSGKTTLAHNLKPLFEALGRDCVIVPEPSVEDGAFSAAHLETQARSDYKAAVHRALLPGRVAIADGMNFIKGFRYELFCFAREIGVGFCCAFCSCSDADAFERSRARYPEKTLRELIARMEAPSARNKWDRPLVVVADPADRPTLEKVVESSLARESKLIAKKATTAGIGASAQVNDRIDRVINEFSEELLRVQGTVPAGGKLTICGATFFLRRPLNPGQLKRAKREFADRAKTIADTALVAQMFADSLGLLF
jgi:protein KTI12